MSAQITVETQKAYQPGYWAHGPHYWSPHCNSCATDGMEFIPHGRLQSDNMHPDADTRPIIELPCANCLRKLTSKNSFRFIDVAVEVEHTTARIF